MTFKIGDKVTLSPDYIKLLETEEFEDIESAKGPARIIGITAGLNVVVFDSKLEWAAGQDQWLMLSGELSSLEEAHPLQNEFANS